jgi:hypothetical protein
MWLRSSLFWHRPLLRALHAYTSCHTRAILRPMLRRMLTFALLIAFGLPLAAQVLGTLTDPDSRLPACCRRHGKHHCAMPVGEAASSSDPAFQAPPCQSYPTAATQAHILDASLVAPPRIGTDFCPDATPAAVREGFGQTFAATAHLTRGPPARSRRNFPSI